MLRFIILMMFREVLTWLRRRELRLNVRMLCIPFFIRSICGVMVRMSVGLFRRLTMLLLRIWVLRIVVRRLLLMLLMVCVWRLLSRLLMVLVRVRWRRILLLAFGLTLIWEVTCEHECYNDVVMGVFVWW